MSREESTVVGVMHLRFAVPAQTLKEKRSAVQPVLARIRGRFHCTAAEVADLNDAGRATIAVACISNESAHCDAMLQAIASFAEHERLDVELLSVSTELIHL